MKQLNSLELSSGESNHDDKDNRNNKSSQKLEKVLCNHCGRTASNGIRCLGICVADNDY